MLVYILWYNVGFGNLVVSTESVLLAVMLGHGVHQVSDNMLNHLYQIFWICYYGMYMYVLRSKGYLLVQVFPSPHRCVICLPRFPP